MQSSKTFTTTVFHQGSTSYIPLSFDPRAVFGRTRVPVTVTINGYSYRSTIAAMGGPPFVPLRRSHREAAGVGGGDRVSVTLAIDTAPREVTPPADLVKALRKTPPAWVRWQGLSYTHRREHVEAIEAAKRPETRQRRIQKAVDMVLALPERRARPRR